MTQQNPKDQKHDPVRTILLPVLGGTVFTLGTAYGFATLGASAQKLELARLEANATGAKTQVFEAEAQTLAKRLQHLQENPAPSGRGDPLPQDVIYSLGRAALPDEVAMWDIDIRPDGTGLPEGRGDVWTGEEIFADSCAGCHGDFGEAVGRWPVLAGGHDTLGDDRPVKTIGSYWPYLSTVYDYVYRAMPFGYSQSLEPDEVYAITAYLLYLNDLVDDDFELSHENFVGVRLPNEENFYHDDRAQMEYVQFAQEPCMKDCKSSVEITARARVIDVTPNENEEEEEANAAPDPEPSATEATPVQTAAESSSAGGDALHALLAIQGDPEYGEYLSSECTACHLSSAGESEIPSIINWPADEFAIALHAYRVKERLHPVMEMVAGRLGDEEIAALAAYFETIKH